MVLAPGSTAPISPTSLSAPAETFGLPACLCFHLSLLACSSLGPRNPHAGSPDQNLTTTATTATTATTTTSHPAYPSSARPPFLRPHLRPRPAPLPPLTPAARLAAAVSWQGAEVCRRRVSQGVSRGEWGDRGREPEHQGRAVLLTPPPRCRPAVPGKMADRAEMFSLSTFHSLSPPGCRYAFGGSRLHPGLFGLPPHPIDFNYPGRGSTLVCRPLNDAPIPHPGLRVPPCLLLVAQTQWHPYPPPHRHTFTSPFRRPNRTQSGPMT